VRFGCHVRVAGGLVKAATYAAEVGCECIQIFAKSPRMWRGPAMDADVAREFTDARRDLGLTPLFVHTAYLINLGSADDTLWERSVTALADELARASILHADGLVTHIGTRCDEQTGVCADRVAEGVAEALRRSPAAPRLLLENSAGAGSTFGGALGEIGHTLCRLDALGAPRVDVCLDTCHAHAYGVDLSSTEAWTAAMDEFDATCGPGRLALLHANDAMSGLGSHRDRHAWIGDGEIGYAGFEAMVCEPRLEAVPVIMEMPGDAPYKDVENLRRLRQLRERCR